MGNRLGFNCLLGKCQVKTKQILLTYLSLRGKSIILEVELLSEIHFNNSKKELGSFNIH